MLLNRTRLFLTLSTILVLLGSGLFIVPITANEAQQEPAPASTPQALPPSIVGGEDAEEGAWPWIAALVRSGSSISNGLRCGASLIDEEWALTAAHCVYGARASTYDLMLGMHKLSEGGERVAIAQVIVHPGYSNFTIDSDVALLRLAQPVSFPTVRLLDEEERARVAPGEEAMVLGWGDTAELGDASDVLQQVTVPIVASDACNAAYQDLYGPGSVTDNMFCAGYPDGGKDACQGDSGGPLILRNGDDWLQAGLVSWGEGCARPGRYGVYTRLSNFDNWIEEYVGLATTETPTPTPVTPTPTPVTPTPTPETPSPTPEPTATAHPVSRLMISNVRDTSVTISWLSDEPLAGSIEWAQTVEEMMGTPTSANADSAVTHMVVLTELVPETTYYFRVRSGSVVDDNGGRYYQITTGPSLPLTESDTVYGEVGFEGEISPRPCLVRVQIVDQDGVGSSGRSAFLSTMSQQDGLWSLNLGNARSQDGAKGYTYSQLDRLVIEAICSVDLQGKIEVQTSEAAPAIPLVVSQMERALLRFQPGWQLTSLPVAPAIRTTAADICAGSQQENNLSLMEIVRWHNSGWDSHICGLAANDFELDAREGYFVRSFVKGDAFITGNPVAPTSLDRLSEGWMLLNRRSIEGEEASDLCSLGGELFTVNEVDRWRAGGWDGHICSLPLNNFSLTDSDGLMLALHRTASKSAPATRSPLLTIRNVDLPVGDLTIANLRDTSLSFAWTTLTPTLGEVIIEPAGDGGDRLVARSERGEPALLHFVTVEGLHANTDYTFQIISTDGETQYGATGSLRTLETTRTIPRSRSGYGRVFGEDGQTPLGNVMVSAVLKQKDGEGSLGSSLPLATTTNESGYWLLNFGNARASDGGLFEAGPGDLVELSIVSPGIGRMHTEIEVGSTNPGPDLVLKADYVYLPAVAP